MPCLGLALALPFRRFPGDSGPPPAAEYLLIETGDFFLLETGDKLIL